MLTNTTSPCNNHKSREVRVEFEMYSYTWDLETKTMPERADTSGITQLFGLINRDINIGQASGE